MTGKLFTVFAITFILRSALSLSQSAAVSSPTLQEFEVASVRPNPVLKGESSKVMNPGGLIFTRVSLSDCLQAAYGLKAYQILAPDWVRTEHFDISARAEGHPDNQHLMLMLQSLLADRFKLRFHREQKDLPVYLLTVAKGGHKLHPSEVEGGMKIQFAAGGMTFQNTSIADLVQFLGAFPFDRSIVDNTGLKGAFDFKMTVGSAELETGDMKRALAQGGASMFIDALAPLGLKLEPEKTLADVLVVDHVERIPTQN